MLSFEQPNFEILVQCKITAIWKVLGKWFWKSHDRATSEKPDLEQHEQSILLVGERGESSYGNHMLNCVPVWFFWGEDPV